MEGTITNFGPILSDTSITTSLSSVKTKLGEIKDEFKILKNLVADFILEKADKIDKTGHVIYALFFSAHFISDRDMIVPLLAGVVKYLVFKREGDASLRSASFRSSFFRFGSILPMLRELRKT